MTSTIVGFQHPYVVDEVMERFPHYAMTDGIDRETTLDLANKLARRYGHKMLCFRSKWAGRWIAVVTDQPIEGHPLAHYVVDHDYVGPEAYDFACAECRAKRSEHVSIYVIDVIDSEED